MRDAAYAVDGVRDGANALESAQSQEYGVVLLDLGLPGKDGMQVLRALRAR
ncbi:response regulator [Acidocella sp.]|uniref:response regulator n=1 Tax=Acidocella sp. TaxID=50710 RepID=UPI00261B95D2|nr:response regulator [Acidocella sp.]MDD2795374.1 response regulator [Acidocella sp.]